MGIRCQEDAPVLIVPAHIIYNQPFGVLEHEHATQHVVFTQIPHQFRTTARISDRNAKMVILDTAIIRPSRFGAGKHENTRFSIAAHFVVGECDTTFGSIQHHARQNPFHRSALRDDACGVEYVER